MSSRGDRAWMDSCVWRVRRDCCRGWKSSRKHCLNRGWYWNRLWCVHSGRQAASTGLGLQVTTTDNWAAFENTSGQNISFRECVSGYSHAVNYRVSCDVLQRLGKPAKPAKLVECNKLIETKPVPEVQNMKCLKHDMNEVQSLLPN